MKYKLGLDLGTNSLGWCILRLSDNDEPIAVENMGVRVFPSGCDEKNKPLSVKRREDRGARRMRDRALERKKELMDFLVKRGLMPENKEERKNLETLNPYSLREKCLDEKVSLFELGRALFHLCQRRGFKSNRKTDKKDKESKGIKEKILNLENNLEGYRSLGEYLYKLNKEKKALRFSSRREVDDTDFYPNRKMYEDEVNLILEKQEEHYPDELKEKIDDERHGEITVSEKIKDIIFYQRKLKPQEIGKCTLDPKEERAPLALPSVQRFRILQEVNNLELLQFKEDERKLTFEDRKAIETLLYKHKNVKFEKIKKELFGKDNKDDFEFNLERNERKELEGDATSISLSKEDSFGGKWKEFSLEKKDQIVERLIEEEDENELITWLEENYNLPLENAREILKINFVSGYGRVSKVAINKIIPFLEEGLVYSEACKRAGYNHSDQELERLDSMPYYGKILESSVIGGTTDPKDKENPEKFYGKINNPNVHVVLGQVRRFVNSLIKKYGKPTEIVVELARDLKIGKKRKEEIKNRQRNDKDRNDEIKKELEELKEDPSDYNIKKYKLWEDLSEDPNERCCPYTGKRISIEKLFSSEVEVDHIIPKSKSFDDSMSNKVLCMCEANRYKKDKTPFEAFGSSPDGYNWDEISRRAKNMEKNKSWRFKMDAMDNEQGDDFLKRQLVDNAYISRITRKYLGCICPIKNITSLPGMLTARLRWLWGLNKLTNPKEEKDTKDSKNRKYHIHHAIDAFVVASTTRSLLQKVSAFYKKAEEKGVKENWNELPEPYVGFNRKDLEQKKDSMIISYKPDHGGVYPERRKNNSNYTVSRLNAETAYGYIGEKEGEKGKELLILAHRVDVSSVVKSLCAAKREDKEDIIADKKIREKIREELKKGSDKKAIEDFFKSKGIKRIRLHENSNKDVVIGVFRDKESKEAYRKINEELEKCSNEEKEKKREERNKIPYKYLKTEGNYCAEIYITRKGKDHNKWEMEVISNYEAHQANFIPKWRKDNPTGKLVMRLFINDMVAYEEKGEGSESYTKYCRVKKIDGSTPLIYLISHVIAIDKETYERSWAASANKLQEKNARQISVDILGQVKDPGSLRSKK